MEPVEIKPGIFWVGAKDWNLREFHGYTTPKGTSYNSYLIIDKKITLVDTVKPAHFNQMLSRLSLVIDPSKIDYIICNHGEMDHAGSLLKILELAPEAEILASPLGEKCLRAHFLDSPLNIRAVHSGESLSTGERSFRFIHTPLVHWPDSMVTYAPGEKLLLSNDSFGQHFTSENILNSQTPDDRYFYEAKKYFANIIYPYNKQAMQALDEVEQLDIEMIAPSHGVIWDKSPRDIVEAYRRWGSCLNNEKALIVYDTMWGSTEKLAYTAAEAFEERAVPVTIRSLSHDHCSDIMTDVLDAKYILIGSSVLNGEILPSTAAFLMYLKGLKPKNKKGYVFGSFGWAKNALPRLEESVKELGWDLPRMPFYQKYVPTPERCAMLKEEVLNLIGGVRASER